MQSLYVYYKVPASKSQIVRRALAALIEAVEQATGIRGRLMRRRDQADTWMEVYEGIADEAGFETALQAAVMSSGVLQLLEQGARHTERFVPLDLTHD